MSSRLPILLLLLLPTLLFPGALPGSKVVAADDHLAAQHAFWNPAQAVTNPERSDAALQFRALRDAVRAAWSEGRAPLWNPHIYGGAPLLADGQSAAFNPLVLLEIALPDATANDLRVWLTLVGLGLGTAWLAGLLGATIWGATVAGTGAMLSGFALGWLLHPHAMAFAWAPWVAASGLWMLRSGPPRSTLVLAITWAGLWTAGHPQTALHGALFSLAVWLLFERRALRPRAVRLATGLAIGTLLASPVLLPFVENALQSTTRLDRGGNALPFRALISLIWPDPFGHPARESWTGSGGHLETNMHVGLAILVLAIASLRTAQGRRLGALALACYAIAFGLPVLDFLPVRNTRLVGFGGMALALAAGLGMPRNRHALWLVLLIALEGLWARRSDQVPISAESFRPSPAAWTSHLVELVGDGRVIGLGWALQPNTASLLSVEDLRGYDLPLDATTERLMRRLDPRLHHPWFPIERFRTDHEAVFQLADVRAIAVVPGDAVAERSVAHLSEVALEDNAPVRLFRLPSAGTRVWLENRGLTPIRDVRRPTPERVEVTLSGGEKGRLILADRWAPSWQVTVDGQPAVLHETSEGFRRVDVGEGDREVVFVYAPPAWKVGKVAGLAGALLLVGFSIAGQRRRLEDRPSQSLAADDTLSS